MSPWKYVLNGWGTLSMTSSKIDTNWCVFFRWTLITIIWTFSMPLGSKWLWLCQPQGLTHHCGVFMCHQFVSGVVISTTRPGSPFWPLCVPSVCKWCGYFNHKAWLTILASLCVIRVWVVWWFKPQDLTQLSGLFLYHQDVSVTACW